MAFEIITLNLIPDGEMPVFHASQYDTARPVIIDLVMGEDAYVVPEGISVELHCRKVDDTIVTMEPDEVSENRVTFVTTEQLTACIGDNLCEVALLNGDDHIGTLNFILHVEPDPLAGGLTSESEIYNLTQQIEDIATEVIGEDYYDKTEVDALLNDKADVSDLPDMSMYYDKTATDTLLSAKADKSDTYTKAQVDSALAAKANTADLATVATTGDYDDLINKPTIPTNTSDLVNDSDFQNETEVNDLIADALLAVMPVDSATGNPCTFDTDIATSLVGLSADIVATQASGTPTPANPLPISGISSLDIVRCGKNLIDDSKKAYVSNNIALGTETYLGKSCYLPAGTYTISVTTLDGNDTNLYCQDLDDSVLLFTQYNVFSHTFTLTKGTNVSFWAYKSTYTSVNDITSAQLELGSTATAYEPYNGQTFTIDLGGTRYGGVYTADGKLRVTWGTTNLSILNWYYIASRMSYAASFSGMANTYTSTDTPHLLCDKYNAMAWNTVATDNTKDNTIFAIPNDNMLRIRDLSFDNDVDAFKASLVGSTFVYELATPIEIDVSSISVVAQSGVNNITSNGGGDVTAQYKVSIQKYIDDHV